MVTMKYWESYYEALKRQKWNNALKALLALKRLEPDNPQIFLKIGDVYRHKGNINKAIDTYKKSAEIFMTQGFFQKALALYKIILGIDPDNDEAINRTNEILNMKLKPSKAEARPMVKAPPIEEAGTKSQPGRLPFILSSLKKEDAEDFLSKAEVVFFSNGQKVIEEGDSGDSIFIIKSGKANVITHIIGREINLATLSEGDIFGEVGFLTGRLRTASVIAQGDLEVIELRRPLIEELIEFFPEVLGKIEDIYGSRVADTLSKVKSIRER